MALVELLCREALDDVCVPDFEGLDDGAEGEELERCGRRHGYHLCMAMIMTGRRKFEKFKTDCLQG